MMPRRLSDMLNATESVGRSIRRMLNSLDAPFNGRPIQQDDPFNSTLHEDAPRQLPNCDFLPCSMDATQLSDSTDATQISDSTDAANANQRFLAIPNRRCKTTSGDEHRLMAQRPQFSDIPLYLASFIPTQYTQQCSLSHFPHGCEASRFH